MEKKESKLMLYLQIIALGFAGGSIFCMPFIRFVYYDWMLEAMGISNAQIGFLMTAYGIGNTIFLIPGGIIADKLSTKKCLLIALLGTTALTFIFAFTMTSYISAVVIWFLYTVTTTFFFWAFIIKAIRLIGEAKEQGFMFGLYYTFNGLSGALMGAIGLQLSKLVDTVSGKFFWAVVAYGFGTIFAAILIAVLLKDRKTQVGTDLKNEPGEEFKFEYVGKLLKSPMVWVFSIIVFAGYSIFSSTSYFTPYLTEVKGITAEDSGYLSVIRSFGFYLLTPLSGLLADKVIKSTSKWFITLFLILAALFAGVLFIPAGASAGFVSLYSLLPGMFGLALYGIIFSITQEMNIPVAVTGTAVGIASIIGYSPDFFLSALFGTWLDNMGSGGYNLIFTYLAINCVIGFIAAFIIVRLKGKKTMLF